jgi:hypothetical protein
MKLTPLQVNGKVFGRIYGGSDTPSFITDQGIRVWMWRKGQRVRLATASGTQIGPEQRNVAPALCAAYAAGWTDPSCPDWLNEGCIQEMKAKV